MSGFLYAVVASASIVATGAGVATAAATGTEDSSFLPHAPSNDAAMRSSIDIEALRRSRNKGEQFIECTNASHLQAESALVSSVVTGL